MTKQQELARRRAYEAAREAMASDECSPDCLERAECEHAGDETHLQCGVCMVHEAPMHHCGCVLKTDVVRDLERELDEKYRTMLREGWF